jgi:RNA polymerase sigma factor (sigma-70 family)
VHVRQTASSCVSNSVISSATGVELSDPAREQAFNEVAGIESQLLFAVALSILRDEGEAQDAVQETLVRAWRAQDSLFRADSPSRWLTRVCVNHCIGRRRHLRSRGWPPMALIEDAISRDPSPAGDHLDVDRAYRRLSLRQRAAITLNYRHGYSVEECAVFMGCRPGTVRTHLARGLATLRKELGDG